MKDQRRKKIPPTPGFELQVTQRLVGATLSFPPGGIVINDACSRTSDDLKKVPCKNNAADLNQGAANPGTQKCNKTLLFVSNQLSNPKKTNSMLINS